MKFQCPQLKSKHVVEATELILSVNQLTRQMELKMQPALLHVDTMFSQCVFEKTTIRAAGCVSLEKTFMV